MDGAKQQVQRVKKQLTCFLRETYRLNLQALAKAKDDAKRWHWESVDIAIRNNITAYQHIVSEMERVYETGGGAKE